MHTHSSIVTVAAAMLAALLSFGPTSTAQGVELKRLHGIGELKSWFNAKRGHPRLIFLLSPT